MAATSFTKTFRVRKQDADEFVKHMTEPSTHRLPKDYKSHYLSLDNPADIAKVKKALAKY